MRIFVSLSCLFLLSACKFTFDSSDPKPLPTPPNPIASCWDAGVKVSVGQLAQTVALNQFTKNLPPDFTAAQVAQIKQTFQVTLSDYVTFSYDKDNQSFVCGASYKYSYTRPNGTSMVHDQGDVMKYDVYQGESGLDPMMTGEEQSTLNIQYETASQAQQSGD